MIRDYVSILGARLIDEPPGEYLPLLTREMAEWTSNASLSLGRSLGGGRADPMVYANAQRVVAAFSRFCSNDIVLPDGTQFATFSIRQMASEIGLSPTSTQPVQRALRLLSLDTKSIDGSAYIEACELLRHGLDGTPLVQLVYKSESRRLASAWKPVGIRPRAHVTDARSAGAAAEERPTAAKERTTAATNLKTVASGLGTAIATVNEEGGGREDSSSTPNVKNQKNSTPEAGESAAKSAAEESGSAATSHSQSQLTPSLHGSDESGYDRVVDLFRCAPGKKSVETRQAYYKRVAEGYSADTLAKGVSKYIAHTPREEQIRFPLLFLSDASLVRAWCGRPPQTLRPENLKMDNEGFWTYPFSAGSSAGYVDCPRHASLEEAFEAVKTMIDRGYRSP